MPWIICGTLHDSSIDILYGPVSVELKSGQALRPGKSEPVFNAGSGDCLHVHTENIASPILLPIKHGITATCAAAALVAQELGIQPPHVLLAGDLVDGGNKKINSWLLKHKAQLSGWGISFNYLSPASDQTAKLVQSLLALSPKPLLCADANFMLAIKNSSYANKFHLFTPTTDELHFLAVHDTIATDSTLDLDDEIQTVKLAQNFFRSGSAPQNMLIKGRVDLVMQDGAVLKRIDYSALPNMKLVAGTGDTLAGSIYALLDAGYSIPRACQLAALTNRLMGQLSQPASTTQIAELLAQLQGALRMALQEV